MKLQIDKFYLEPPLTYFLSFFPPSSFDLSFMNKRFSRSMNYITIFSVCFYILIIQNC